MSNRYYSAEFKYKVIKAYQSGNYTLNDIYSKFKIKFETLYIWMDKFERYGFEGLKDKKKFKRYSKELKESAVRDFLSGEYSGPEVVRKYELCSKSLLQQWIKKYNSHGELKDTPRGRARSMTKGRKTTLEERIEIVQDALGNRKNYHKTAEKYQVSYHQVHSWVRKYEEGGWDALIDRRGRKKREDELTPEEKIKLEIRRVEKENEYLRAENAYLKKLQEIERRRN